MTGFLYLASPYSHACPAIRLVDLCGYAETLMMVKDEAASRLPIE